ncbi:MAG TPA: hypothetical protein VE685_11335 [Thermoanaerobaculia bacterium]|nr:hypothetical protein [Thermoanaerobaculia bacterium]
MTAVDLRLTVRLSSSPGSGVRLDLPGLPHSEEISWAAVLSYARAARERWTDYSREPGPERFSAVRGDDPAHIVKAALGEVLEALGDAEPPGLCLRIDSTLPIGSGFGSSAAAAVAVVAATLAWRRAAVDLPTVERLALEVERRQHGLPSGVDSATILRGGLLWARRTGSGLEIEPVEVRSPLLSRFRVYDTGMPAEPTGSVVAAVRAQMDRDCAGTEIIFDRIEAAARAFREELARDVEAPARVVELIRKCEVCLEGLGVVPEAVRAVVRRVEAEGGAAKISGAGSLSGPGAGSLLVFHPEPERMAGWGFLQSFRFHPVQLGAEGLRREEA